MLVVAVYSSLNNEQPVFPEPHEQEGRADLCFKHVMNGDEIPTWETGAGGSWRSLKLRPISVFLCYSLLYEFHKSGEQNVSEIVAGLPGGRTRWAPHCWYQGCWRHKQRRVLSSPFACLHTAGRLCPYLLLLGLEKTGEAEGRWSFHSEPPRTAKFPNRWAHISVRPLYFPFPEPDHLEKRQVTIPMDKLLVSSVANPWQDWSLHFVSKPSKCSRH